MKKHGENFEATIPLHEGDLIQYKFVVDNEWLIDEAQPSTNDGHGNVNNTMKISKGEETSSRTSGRETDDSVDNENNKSEDDDEAKESGRRDSNGKERSTNAGENRSTSEATDSGKDSPFKDRSNKKTRKSPFISIKRTGKKIKRGNATPADANNDESANGCLSKKNSRVLVKATSITLRSARVSSEDWTTETKNQQNWKTIGENLKLRLSMNSADIKKREAKLKVTLHSATLLCKRVDINALEAIPPNCICFMIGESGAEVPFVGREDAEANSFEFQQADDFDKFMVVINEHREDDSHRL